MDNLELSIILALLAVGLLISFWIGKARGRASAPGDREKLLREIAGERERLVREMNSLRDTHRVEVEDARRDSVKQSRSTLSGHMIEKLAPHLPDFPYDPTEVRFLGSPIDYVVFRGLSQDKVEEIVFLEVKSGKSELTKRERSLRNAVREAKVTWGLYQFSLGDAAPHVDLHAVNDG